MTTLAVPPGTVFGRWTVIEQAVSRSSQRRMLCQCECGTTKILYLHNLKSGRTTSCGCALAADVPPGTVFGHLAVIKEAGRAADGSRRMLCGCECGVEVIVHLSNLRRGHTQSCGCRGAAQPDLSRLRPGEVPLYGEKAGGRIAYVDAEDYDLVMQYRWHVFEPARRGRTSGPYPMTNLVSGGRENHLTVLMHKLLTGWTLTDHIDGNGLNNRRSNLRPATNAQNIRNAGSRGGTSQFKGVWRHRNGRWRAHIVVDGKRTHLGYFADETKAALAYDDAAIRLHGAFARLNFPARGATA